MYNYVGIWHATYIILFCRGFARAYIKDLEKIRPSAIIGKEH